MVFINLVEQEINYKIAYWGPALSGRGSNLRHIYKSYKSSQNGKDLSDWQKINLYSQLTAQLCYFSFVGFQEVFIDNLKLRTHISCLTAPTMYQEVKLKSLRGVDAIVFVADSQKGRESANIEYLWMLTEFFKKNNKDINTIPYVLQLNKRDLEEIQPVETLKEILCFKNESVFEAIAYKGIGVMETFNEIYKLTINEMNALEKHGQIKESTFLDEYGFELDLR